MPHQCAHWLAMTCRRQKRVCGCKDAARNDMQKEGRVRGCKDVARNDMQKEGRVRVCKDVGRKVRGNMPGVSGCKALVRNDTSPLSLRGAKRRGNPHPRRKR